MSSENIVISVFAKDRSGIISDLASAVLSQKANWLHSSSSRLCGHFSGLLQIEVGS